MKQFLIPRKKMKKMLKETLDNTESPLARILLKIDIENLMKTKEPKEVKCKHMWNGGYCNNCGISWYVEHPVLSTLSTEEEHIELKEIEKIDITQIRHEARILGENPDENILDTFEFTINELTERINILSKGK